MTKIINTLTAMVVSVLLAGCTTLGISTETQQALIVTAASTGTMLYLQSHPADAGYFSAAASVLNMLAGSTDSVSLKTVQDALTAGGVNTPVITTSIANAINLANSFIARNSPTNEVAFQQASGWVAQGITQGLQTTTRSRLKAAKLKK